MQNHFPTRREFTLEAALAMLSGVVITVSGCGGSTSLRSPMAPSPIDGAVSGSISANHGHSVTITRAQMTAGGDLTFDIRGSADHAHTVTLSQSQLLNIAAGQRVSVESTSEQAHTHTVTFN